MVAIAYPGVTISGTYGYYNNYITLFRFEELNWSWSCSSFGRVTSPTNGYLLIGSTSQPEGSVDGSNSLAQFLIYRQFSIC
jgi:hypothetical protein